MPAVLLMTFFARLGDLLALTGALAGLWRFRKLSGHGRWLTAFLLLSAVSGVGEAVLRHQRLPNAQFGNLWDFSLLLFGMLALNTVARSHIVRIVQPLQLAATLLWVLIFIVDDGLPKFNYAASAGCYALVAASAFITMSQWLEDSSHLWRKYGFVVAFSLFIGCATDVSITIIKMIALSPGLRYMMAYRNAVWCLVYLLLGYSLLLKRRPQRSVLPTEPEHHFFRAFLQEQL